jgi:hypothetical protein
MKEEKNFLVYFWLPIGTYHKNLEIWNLFLQSSKFGSLISWFFCIRQNHVKILQSFTSKRNAYGNVYKHLAFKRCLGWTNCTYIIRMTKTPIFFGVAYKH